MKDVPRYGQRRIDLMLPEWNALRELVSNTADKELQDAFARCDEWIGWAFGEAGMKGKEE